MAVDGEGDNPTTHNYGSVSDEDEDPWKKDSTYLTMGDQARPVVGSLELCSDVVHYHPKQVRDSRMFAPKITVEHYQTCDSEREKSFWYNQTQWFISSKKCHPAGSGKAHVMDDEKRQVSGD
jgi:hypothetical protein